MELDQWFDEWIFLNTPETFDEYCARRTENEKLGILYGIPLELTKNVARGQFNQLFAPGIRKAMMDAQQQKSAQQVYNPRTYFPF